MEFRSLENASKCKDLKISRKGKDCEGPVTLGFVCVNLKVKGKFAQAQFSSLDVCCVCEHYTKE